jgi:hypothetical protein
MAGAALLWGIVIGPSPLAVRVPLPSVRKPVTVPFGKVVEIAREREQEVDISAFESDWRIPASFIAPVWRLLPVVIRDPFFDAAHYYAASLRGFTLMGDAEAIAEDPSVPASRKNAVEVETAVQDAFKAVEALIGDPPADDSRLARKLANIGVEPDRMIGFDRFGHSAHSETVIRKIRKMNLARDKRVAHGATPKPRAVTYYELMDFQECAGFIVSTAVKKELRERGWHVPVVEDTKWFGHKELPHDP